MKQLITAGVVREAQKNGQKVLAFSATDSIVTPEAKSVAKELGVELVPGGAVCQAPAAGQPDMQKIREVVLSQLGSSTVPEDVLTQLICKVANEQKQSNCCGTEGVGTHQAMFTTAAGIKRIKGDQVPMGIMDAVGREKQIGIADIVGAADSNSPMAAGYMGWKNCFFPWTLNYDEINVVLEGELHIRCGGETSIARAGDVLFIPKGSSIEFGTPSSVRFVFVSYPANWQEA